MSWGGGVTAGGCDFNLRVVILYSCNVTGKHVEEATEHMAAGGVSRSLKSFAICELSRRSAREPHPIELQNVDAVVLQMRLRPRAPPEGESDHAALRLRHLGIYRSAWTNGFLIDPGADQSAASACFLKEASLTKSHNMP